MKRNLINWGFLVAAGLLATQAAQALGATDKLSGENGAVGAQMPTSNPAYRPDPPAPKSPTAKKRAAAEIQRVLEES